jgi:hypothetical protein
VRTAPGEKVSTECAVIMPSRPRRLTRMVDDGSGLQLQSLKAMPEKRHCHE